MQTVNILGSGDNAKISIQLEKNMIIVGANGSGKTRFGSQIEQLNNPSKRISAQRYLQLQDTIERQDYDTASNQLRANYKNQSPNTPQNDYQQVMVSLFAQEARRNEEFVDATRNSTEKIDPPQSIKEKVLEVWDFVFPNRELKLEKDKVQAINHSNRYSATQMSDGEKVGLYLIAQVLLVESNCILIIDEPELHLHKSLMVRLWNKLEEYRNDCTFIYITHDLDFAVSKPSTKLIWIKDFIDGRRFREELDPNGVIPDNLFLEVLGSRKPILFVEGEKGSLDAQIYQSFYETFTVIPRSSCEKVIEAVKGLKDNADLHDKAIYGLIDRDFRPDDQINSLLVQGVHTIPLNEIENLFLIPEIIELVCNHLLKSDKKEDIINAIKEVYRSNKEQIYFKASKYRLQRIINEKFGIIGNLDQYEAYKATIINDMDHEMSTIVLPDDNADLNEILKRYPHKGLINQVQGKIDFTKNGYRDLVLSFLNSEKRQSLINILKQYLPEIPLNS